MSFRPAETIRAYLDEHDGETRVPFHNLLTTWQLDEAEEAERRRIEEDLEQAGVVAEPALAGLNYDDEVTLRVAPTRPREAPEEPPTEAQDEAHAFLAGLLARGAVARVGATPASATVTHEIASDAEGHPVLRRRGFSAV